MLTGLQLSKKVLEESKVPMNPEEIWTYAVDKGYVDSCSIAGKTPSRTIGAQIYTHISKYDDSPFYKYSTKPQKFGLRALQSIYSGHPSKLPDKKPSTFCERDLHPLLVAFIKSNDYFHAYSKTIYHEKSSKTKRNAEKWLHPDIVAVHYTFEDLNKNIVELAAKVGVSVIRLYSFELKKEITTETVREYYFQAVSNSSWANEGYLVAPKITDDAIQQLGKLNSSFGIGVIKLNLDDIYQSEVIIQARYSETLDLGMMDELVGINPDFDDFVKNIHKTLKTDEPVTKHYDEVLDSDQLAEYISEKHIR